MSAPCRQCGFDPCRSDLPDPISVAPDDDALLAAVEQAEASWTAIPKQHAALIAMFADEDRPDDAFDTSCKRCGYVFVVGDGNSVLCVDCLRVTAQIFARIITSEASRRTREPILAVGVRSLLARVARAEEMCRAALEDVASYSPFKRRTAETLADEVAVLVRRKIIDSRDPAADALLYYRDPPSSERADRLAEVERDRDAARTALAAMTAARDEAVNWIADRTDDALIVARLRAIGMVKP